MKKYIFVHIAVINNVNYVLNHILDTIYKSGLYNQADKIFLCINGDPSLLFFTHRDKYIIINQNNNIFKYEFPTLYLLWDICQKEDCYVLYLHTKGVSKDWNRYIGMSDWLDCMLYFNVERYNDCIKSLNKGNDVVGVMFYKTPTDIDYEKTIWKKGEINCHFSGNFWWSKSSHLRALTKPSSIIKNNDYFNYRMYAEMYICRRNDIHTKTLYNPNINTYDNRLSRSKYEIKE